jgi:hypothetical protein
MSVTARRSDRRVRRVIRPVRFLVGAAAIALSLATASTATALASSFRLPAPSVAAFASDGARYAAWQVTKSSPIVVLDTRSGRRKELCRVLDRERRRSLGWPGGRGRTLSRWLRRRQCAARRGDGRTDATATTALRRMEGDRHALCRRHRHSPSMHALGQRRTETGTWRKRTHVHRAL